MIITSKQQRKFQKTTRCWICWEELVKNKNIKIMRKDHCHFTGKNRGPTHNECNGQFKKKEVRPFFFNNLYGYDSHLFIKNIGKTPRKY